MVQDATTHIERDTHIQSFQRSRRNMVSCRCSKDTSVIIIIKIKGKGLRNFLFIKHSSSAYIIPPPPSLLISFPFLKKAYLTQPCLRDKALNPTHKPVVNPGG